MVIGIGMKDLAQRCNTEHATLLIVAGQSEVWLKVAVCSVSGSNLNGHASS